MLRVRMGRLTRKQRKDQMRVEWAGGPIQINYETEFCVACGQRRPMSDQPWWFNKSFHQGRYEIVRCRTFREACDKVREIFPKE